MDLILWRHAEAAEDGFEDDLERPLTPRGERQAARITARGISSSLAPK